MLQQPYKTLLLLTCLAMLLMACTGNKEKASSVKIPRLNPKFNYRDKEPMGSFAAYHYAESLFKNGIADVTEETFSTNELMEGQVNSVYLIISRLVFLSNNDRKAMLRYVSNGNTIFISAEYIDRLLMDTLDIAMNSDLFEFVGTDEYKMDKDDTWVSVPEVTTDKVNRFGFYYLPFNNSFIPDNEQQVQELGYNPNKRPNFIAVRHGSGNFIFHAAPKAFSNYFLLTNDNHRYLEYVFSYFDKEASAVYWDNYYRQNFGGQQSYSIVDFFKRNPPLYNAFLLVLALLLLFLAFGGKRRQRIIPVKVPPANSTVSYTETIGRLYLQKKDNHNIAQKMITYFLDHVRNHYYLDTRHLNNDFAGALARKSGMTEARAQELVMVMNRVQQDTIISDFQLLELHNLVQQFLKK